MKKKIFIGIAAVAVAAIATVNVNFASQNNDDLSTMVLANAEALAGEADNGSNLKWSGNIRCSTQIPGATGSYRVCQDNGSGNACSPGGATTCTCGVNC